MDKTIDDVAAALAEVRDSGTVLFGGFGVMQGWPNTLLLALRDHGARDLTIVCNATGAGPWSAQVLADAGLVRKVITTFAAYPARETPIEDGIRAGRIACELVSQGTLAERVRAGGAGLGAFWTPVGADTVLSDGKERRVFDGRMHVLEHAIRADLALVRAHRADRHGNLTYRRAARNFHPVFATAARRTLAEVDEIVEAGALDPEAIHTPGIFVDGVVRTRHPLTVAEVLELRRVHGRKVAMEARAELGGLPPDLMARRVALLLHRGEYVNLGLGLPALVSNVVGDRDVVLHAENGVLGYGPLADFGSPDVDCYNATGQFVSLLPGAAFVDSAVAHAMARGGRIGTVVLGAFQVSERGDLANWRIPETEKGGVGGAMDLVAGGARVVAMTFHTTRAGAPKLVRRCTYPLTAAGCVREIVTDLGYFTNEAEGLVLRELAPGVPVETVRRHTDATFRVASDVREMTFT
jgi:3-oxoacid CoA-transferase